MNNDNSSKIKLTLGEDSSTAFASAPETDTKVLETSATEIAAAVKDEISEEKDELMLDTSVFSQDELKMIEDFSSKIDITNTNMVLQYGASAQQKMAEFSDSALEKVKTKDFGELGDMITELVVQLNGMNEEEKGGFLGLFKKQRQSIEKMKTKYNAAEKNVNSIVNVLESHQITLLKDISTLDKLYETNLEYFKEISMYIIAGKKCLDKARNETLTEMKAKAERTSLPEDAQAANDYSAMCDRFEKKLHDLMITRMISIQMSPQIRMIQNNNSIMSEKIQSTIVNTIPLWKSQMLIALGISHSQQAMEAQRAVSNITNELLKKNAEQLKTGTIEIAKESERGIVDMETLVSTNKSLVDTLDEVQRIQREGHEKRKNAEIELNKMEAELKKKLLDLNS